MTEPPSVPEQPAREQGAPEQPTREQGAPEQPAAEPADLISRRFVFREGAFQPLAPVPDARQRLLVADSFLVAEGRARAVDLHHDRFVGSALASGYTDRVLLDTFWAAALEAIPPIHRWFPRVELSATASYDETGTHRQPPRHELSLLMRLAPEPSSTAVLATHGGEDPRSIPSMKGPDLVRLTALRDAARADGIDDVVILTADGAIIDGTTTAILWWRGDELHLPPADLARVDSVTARTIRVLAQATGVPVVEERATPTDLRGLEVWAVNALYGVRHVTEWRGGPAVRSDPTRAPQWQRRLDALARALG
ncbi:MAG: hypothetical protein JWQ64_2610 [Subtercola sp.]|nr:hypothetical protein [Subtercola sp.]